MESKQLRVLIFAYACDPDSGSEAGAGAALLEAARANSTSVTVITRPMNDTVLSGEIDAHQVGPKFGQFPVYVGYFLWVLAATRRASQLRRQQRFDVVHHATYASDWFFNPLVFLRKQRHERWIWGPAGGASYPPRQVVRAVLGFYPLSEFFRVVATRVIRRIVHMALRRRIDAVIAMNDDSSRQFLRSGFDGVQVSANIVMDYSLIPPADPRPGTILFAGRGEAWKGLDLTIRALKHLPDWQLLIAGPGTDSAPYRRTAEQFADRVEFVGILDRQETLRTMARTRVFALPSLHDSAGWAAAEAAGMGIPVVCLPFGGVPTVAGGCAHVIDVDGNSSIEAAFADAVRRAAGARPAPHRVHTRQALARMIGDAYAKGPRR